MHFFVEVENQGDGLVLVRPHRAWFGRLPKDTPTQTFEKVEVPELASDDPTLFCIELQPDELLVGQSVQLKGGLTLTSQPELYGDPDDRLQAGKKAAVRLRFEEWMPLF